MKTLFSRKNLIFLLIVLSIIELSACSSSDLETATQEDNTVGTTTTANSETATQENNTVETTTTANSESAQNDTKETKIVYHEDEVIQDFLDNYNTINTDLPISPDDMKKSYRRNQAIISLYNTYIEIWSVDGNIKISIEDTDDTNQGVEKMYFSFMKTLDTSISDEELESLWTELVSDKYIDENGLEHNGTYSKYFESDLYGITIRAEISNSPEL